MVALLYSSVFWEICPIADYNVDVNVIVFNDNDFESVLKNNKGSTTWSKAATGINFYIGYNILLRDMALTEALSRDVYSRDVF